MNWFYESAGQQQGPVSDEDLDRLLAEGKIQPETLVWREGQADWQPLRTARPDESAGGAPGTARCASCGQFFPQAELAQIGGRAVCPGCKPAVLQGIQQGVLLPGSDESGRTGPAWEQRETLGFVKAIWETIRESLTNPSFTFSNMRREGGIGTPFLYFFIMATAAGIFSNIVFGFFRQLTGFQNHPAPNLQGPLLFMATPAFNFLMAGFAPVMAAIAPFIGAGILHLCLMLCGGARQPFETTFRVYCYSVGSSTALQFVPVCGAYIGGIWALVTNCIGLARAHEITTGRAVLAVLLPVIVVCLLAVVAAVVLGAGFAAMRTHH